MDDDTKYEIKAEAFRIMTGHMAPGKSPSPETYPATPKERYEAWLSWLSEYEICIRAMLIAVDRVQEDGDG